MSTGFVGGPGSAGGEPPPRRSQIAPIAEAVAILDNIPGGGLILTTVEAALNWGRASSIWPLTFGLACCAIEMMAAYASRFDLDRMGAIPRATPRQADLIIVAGRATIKIAPIVRRLWEQMADPTHGATASTHPRGAPPHRDPRRREHRRCPTRHRVPALVGREDDGAPDLRPERRPGRPRDGLPDRAQQRGGLLPGGRAARRH